MKGTGWSVTLPVPARHRLLRGPTDREKRWSIVRSCHRRFNLVQLVDRLKPVRLMMRIFAARDGFAGRFAAWQATKNDDLLHRNSRRRRTVLRGIGKMMAVHVLEFSAQ
jgi:hypothetical protein